METLELSLEQRTYLCDSEYFYNAVVCVKNGVNPVDVIMDLCKHIDNLNNIIDEA